jgi:chaperonin cofactor prefoldin
MTNVNIDSIDTKSLLNKITKIETLSFSIKSAKQQINEKNTIVSQYKSLLQYLFENQSFKDNNFITLIPGSIFLQLERKESVTYVQNTISALLSEVNTLKKQLFSLKESLLKLIDHVSESNYLDDDVYIEMEVDLQKKFSKVNSKNVNDNDSDSD